MFIMLEQNSKIKCYTQTLSFLHEYPNGFIPLVRRMGRYREINKERKTERWLTLKLKTGSAMQLKYITVSHLCLCLSLALG